MTGRKAIVLTSLGGREHMFGPDAIHGDLTMGMLRHVIQGTLGYVGYEVYEPFVAFHVPYVTDEARPELPTSFDAQITALHRRTLLEMPRLGEFDEQFRPIAG